MHASTTETIRTVNCKMFFFFKAGPYGYAKNIQINFPFSMFRRVLLDEVVQNYILSKPSQKKTGDGDYVRCFHIISYNLRRCMRGFLSIITRPYQPANRITKY